MTGRQKNGFQQLPRALAWVLAGELDGSEAKIMFAVLSRLQYRHIPKNQVSIPGSGERRALYPGEMITSCAKLAEATRLSVDTVSKKLDALSKRLPWFSARKARGIPGRSGGTLITLNIEAAGAWARGRLAEAESPDPPCAEDSPYGPEESEVFEARPRINELETPNLHARDPENPGISEDVSSEDEVSEDGQSGSLREPD